MACVCRTDRRFGSSAITSATAANRILKPVKIPRNVPRPQHSSQRDIETIARLEKEYLDSRNVSERFGDAVGRFVGTIHFVLIHLAWFTVWFVVNTGTLPAIHPFDPFPFILLSMIVSVESVVLLTFVLIMQNRMARNASHTSHLNLQVSLLAEKEATKAIQLLRRICEKLNIDVGEDPDLRDLSESKELDALSWEVRQHRGE